MQDQNSKLSEIFNHDLAYRSATDLLSALRTKHISAVELLDATISRIEKYDKHINAVVVRDFERARIAAKQADDALAKGEQKPLLGLPMTVKESFNIAGLTSNWGNPFFKDWQPMEDALVISRLKKAGAIIIGKTNVPFMLTDWQSYNDIYGTTNNPWNLNLTTGGSSGGSAAALAAGFVSLELGSDLAGSLRTPAHYCGVYAHKPSSDLVPLRGASPPTTLATSNRVDLVVAGPMSRTANDLALALNIIAGPDEFTDGKAYQLFLPPSRHTHLQDFRVLLIDENPLYPTANIIRQSLNTFADKLIKSGVKVVRDYSHLPDLAEITKNYATLLYAWEGGNLPLKDYEHLISLAKNLDINDKSLTALCLRSNVMNHRDWVLTTRTRTLLQQQWRNLYRDFDVILCPVMPTLAFPHDHNMNIEERIIEIDSMKLPYAHQFIWICFANLFGLPATVAPIDQSEEGLPIGMQIIGDYLEDNTTITFAKLIEREFGGFKPPQLNF